MADDEIIILESDDESSQDDIQIPLEDQTTDEEEQPEKSQTQEETEKKKKKKVLLFGIAGVIVLLALFILIITIVTKNSANTQVMDINESAIAKKLNEQKRPPQFSPSRLENMIRKANVLYERGNKQEALKYMSKLLALTRQSPFTISVLPK